MYRTNGCPTDTANQTCDTVLPIEDAFAHVMGQIEVSGRYRARSFHPLLGLAPTETLQTTVLNK